MLSDTTFVRRFHECHSQKTLNLPECLDTFRQGQSINIGNHLQCYNPPHLDCYILVGSKCKQPVEHYSFFYILYFVFYPPESYYILLDHIIYY